MSQSWSAWLADAVGFSAPSALPFPPSWLTDAGAAEAAASSIKSISLMPMEHFLQAATVLPIITPLPELERATFLRAWGTADAPGPSKAGATDFKLHATAAAQRDSNLNALVYKCVPCKVSEAEFWWCFFIWAHQLLRQQRGLLSQPLVTEAEREAVRIAEQQLQEEAEEYEEQSESFEDEVAAYDAEVLEPLREELAELQAAYEQHLADSTDNPHRHPSLQNAKVARMHKRAVEEAEARLEDAKGGLREYMASMRREQHKGRRAWAQ